MTELVRISIVLKGNYSSEQKELGKAFFLNLVNPLSIQLYRQDVDIQVHLEDGSLKIVLAIAGSLYIAIGQYGSFRSGLDQIGKDAHVIESLVKTELMKNGFPEDGIVSIRRQTRFTTKLKRLMNRVERLNSYAGNDKQRKHEINLVVRNIETLIQEATDEADKTLILLAIEEVDDLEQIIKKNPDRPKRLDRNNHLFFTRNEGDVILSNYLRKDNDLRLIESSNAGYRTDSFEPRKLKFQSIPMIEKIEPDISAQISANSLKIETENNGFSGNFTDGEERPRCCFCLKTDIDAGQLYSRENSPFSICGPCARDAFLVVENE